MNAMTVYAASPNEVDMASDDSRERGGRPTVSARPGLYGVLFRSEVGYLVQVIYDANNNDRSPEHTVPDGMES